MADGKDDAGDAWKLLEAQRRRIDAMRLREAFAEDPARAARYRVEAAGLTLDYSRNLLDDELLATLLCLAEQSGVAAQARSMMSGATMNLTEGRAVLHTLLRAQHAEAALSPLLGEVRAAQRRMAHIVEQLHSGHWRGWSGESIRDVVNIGIGGSHLGPCFVADALGHLARAEPRVHFVSNVDPRDLERVLQRCDPARTLFIVASKSFTTLETRENALAARRWVRAGGCPAHGLQRHFLAVSASVARASEFGIAAENVLPMWDWVGGRYSLWSTIGLPIAVAVGMGHFEALLLGAQRMDLHFRDAPAARNMPLIMALLSVWYRNFWAVGSQAVIPYDQSLARLPEYLQQLVMESNGKRVDREGRALARASSGVLWGAAGTNGQHSFHQLLHQGSDMIPVDFILPLRTHAADTEQHAHLVANCIAQSQALMLGRSHAEALAELRSRGLDESEAAVLAPHLVMPGNRPSNTVVMREMTPETLGALIALYEHRTAVEGFLWNINSFDQFGVELGKRLGENVWRMLHGDEDAAAGVDASTLQLVNMYRHARTAP